MWSLCGMCELCDSTTSVIMCSMLSSALLLTVVLLGVWGFAVS
jgi:hypothetical protein